MICYDSRTIFGNGIRVSTEINFVGISIGIPIEINFDCRRNYWSKLSKVIGISISTIKIEIPISNKNRIFTYFREKCFEISTFALKFCTVTGIPMSWSKFRFRNRNQNRNSYVEMRNRNSDFDIEISTKSVWNFVVILISSIVNNRNWNRNRNIEISTKNVVRISISSPVKKTFVETLNGISGFNRSYNCSKI
jgi:hypothetical protein